MCYSLGTSVGDFRCIYNIVVYIIVRKVELVVKGRALPYIVNEGSSGGSIRTYL